MQSTELFYHTSDGKKLDPRAMSEVHLKNAIRSLQTKRETDSAIYPVLCQELVEREKRKTSEEDRKIIDGQGNLFE